MIDMSDPSIEQNNLKEQCEFRVAFHTPFGWFFEYETAKHKLLQLDPELDLKLAIRPKVIAVGPTMWEPVS